MPTLEELGQKVKAKYPQYAQVPDAELGAKVKAKYPDAYKDFEGTASTFDRMKQVHEKASQNIFGSASTESTKRYEQAQSSATQDIKNYYGRAAGEVAAMVPPAIAASVASGGSAPAAVGIMGLGGLMSGVFREGTKQQIGSSEVPKGWDLAKALGADTAWGAGGAVFGRGLFLAKSQLPKVLEKAAIRSTAGRELLESNYAQMRTALDSRVGKKLVDIEQPLMAVKKELELLPKGLGPVGEQFTGLTSKAEETYGNIIKSVEAKKEASKLVKGLTKAKARQVQLENVSSGVQAGEEVAKTGRQIIAEMEAKLTNLINGKISSHQPLDALIEIKGNAQQMAWGPSTNVRERPIFRRMAEKLDGIIKTQIAGDPEAAQLYKEANDLGKTVFQTQVANTMAQKFIHSYATRMLGYSIAGAGAGAYYTKGDPLGMATGAAVGAGVSVGVPKLATLILQQTAAHKEGWTAFSKGLDFAMKGDQKSANDMIGRAFAVAGVRETIKEYFRQQAAPPPETFIGP